VTLKDGKEETDQIEKLLRSFLWSNKKKKKKTFGIRFLTFLMDTSHRGRGGSGHGGGYGRGGGRGRTMIPKADRGVYDGKSKRPMIVRKAVDFQSDAITYVTVRLSTTISHFWS
jgi:hypothetical protein